MARCVLQPLYLQHFYRILPIIIQETALTRRFLALLGKAVSRRRLLLWRSKTM
jgi:hypothetical protein